MSGLRAAFDATRDVRLLDIQAHPENHRHTIDELVACCTIKGVHDIGLMEAHGEFASVGVNGGINCDVTSGPCACGATH